MIEQLAGRVFGRWTVICRAPDVAGATAWFCRCACGVARVVRTTPLRKGKTKSCGCLAAELSRARRQTHGMRGTKEYKTWATIKRRCRNPNDRAFFQYGARGIDVCDRWAQSFEAFLADMGIAPTQTHSIDRIDNARGYEPGNCRWATKSQQAINRSNTVFVAAFGETKCKAEWARDARCRVKLSTLERRLWAGWDAERAISAPTLSLTRDAQDAIRASVQINESCRVME